MVITAKMVAELRERTGSGMMDCKKALTQTDGDIEKAIEVLREKGLAAAAKKAGRIAAEGLVSTYIVEDSSVGSIVEFNCETDFVAQNNDFIQLSNGLAKQVALSNVNSVEELLASKYIENNAATVQETITGLIAKLGENMNVRRFNKLSVNNGIVYGYIHGGGRIGVIVSVEGGTSDSIKEVAKELSLQIAAANPLFLSKEEVTGEALDKEKEIYRQQALNEGKPENIVEKMVNGRIQKYYKEVCLIEQPWIRDQDLTIKKFIENKSKELGVTIKIDKFVRFEKGEGIEKKEENFAEEVMKQTRS